MPIRMGSLNIVYNQSMSDQRAIDERARPLTENDGQPPCAELSSQGCGQMPISSISTAEQFLSVGGVGVSYSGELDNAVINGTSNIWAPNSSFIGGTVTTSPSTVNDDLRLNGTSTGVNALTFATPLENPVFAIWSLGAPGLPASFIFNATPTLEAGGPNSQFGGSSIIVNGNTVTGSEGNGVVQFTGTFNSISWTNTFENFYAFTVGINGPLQPPSSVPEPSSLLLTSLGLLVFALRLRKRK